MAQELVRGGEKSKKEKAVRKRLSRISRPFTGLFFPLFFSLLCLSMDKCEKSILGDNYVFYDVSFSAGFFFPFFRAAKRTGVKGREPM